MIDIYKFTNKINGHSYIGKSKDRIAREVVKRVYDNITYKAIQ